tara:strand:+ start:42 stop:599 length:558 start_codon:yes stop_codon:yes gene_type:complete
MSQIICGNVIETAKEYFRVMLTSDQTGLSDNSSNDVNFASNGSVVYDTLSNWDASTNSYQLGSSDGVYLINFSIGVSSPTVTAESIIDAGGVVRFSDDNFSSFLGTPEFGNVTRGLDENSGAIGSIAVSASSIYKATAASVKVKLQGYANTDATTYTIRNDCNGMSGGSVSSNATITFLEIVRIT